MKNEEINPYWKTSKQYSILELAYLAAYEKPKTYLEFREKHNQACVNFIYQIVDYFKKTDERFVTEILPAFKTDLEREEFICNMKFPHETALKLLCIIQGTPNFLYQARMENQQKTHTSSKPDYLDSIHPMYSVELAIAIETWNAVLKDKPEKPKKGSRKSLIMDYLNNHHKELTNKARERIAEMLNPDKNGGAPKSE